MSQARIHPLEQVLRWCAQSAPQPWFYRVFAKNNGVEPERLVDILELLWLEGLVQKAPGSPETGPGVTVTELGQQVVEDPEALRRLCSGDPVREGDVGSTIRQSLRHRILPFVTRMIVAANVIVFAIGAWYASKRPGLLSAYMQGLSIPRAQAMPFTELLHQLGSLSMIDLVRGEWWRLLTATFLHAGLLHLGMNMYGMWMLGSFVERTYGHWRLFAIYFISGWGSSCFAMTYSSGGVGVGASGAICGVMAADIVWILLYGRYLPKNMARAGRTQMVTSLFMLAFFSMLPGVGWQAHLGGVIVGAAAALALHFQRFGSTLSRVLGIVALMALPWASYAWMERGRATNKVWLDAEMNEFNDSQIPPMSKSAHEAFTLYEQTVKPLLERGAPRREDVKTKAATDALSREDR